VTTSNPSYTTPRDTIVPRVNSPVDAMPRLARVDLTTPSAAVGPFSSAFQIRFIRNSGYGGGMRPGLGEAGLLSRARSLYRS